jgi:hypothetical protein
MGIQVKTLITVERTFLARRRLLNLMATMDKGWLGRMGSEGVCFGLIR